MYFFFKSHLLYMHSSIIFFRHFYNLILEIEFVFLRKFDSCFLGVSSRIELERIWKKLCVYASRLLTFHQVVLKFLKSVQPFLSKHQRKVKYCKNNNTHINFFNFDLKRFKITWRVEKRLYSHVGFSGENLSFSMGKFLNKHFTTYST